MTLQDMEILFLSNTRFKRICKIFPVPGNAEKIPARNALDRAIRVIIGGRAWKKIPDNMVLAFFAFIALNTFYLAIFGDFS